MFFYKKVIIVLFLIVMAVPNTASAQTACVGGGLLGGIQSLLSGNLSGLLSDAVPVAEKGEALGLAQTDTMKECFLDGLTVKLREVLIEELTASIIDWINSGFDGNPMFITNFGDFFTEVGNEAVGRFIDDAGLNGLCNSFEVKLAITQDYYSSYEDKAKCRPEEVADNFSDWNNFFSFITGRGDLYTEYFDASKEVEYQTLSELEEQERLLKDTTRAKCKSDKNGDVICDEVETPAEVVEAIEIHTVQGPLRQLEMADEIDEIINALLGQLSKQVLGGGGLSGLSKSSGGSSSYTSKLKTRGNETSGSSEVRSNSLVYINGVISTENSYKNAKEDTEDILNESNSLLIELISCSPSNGELVTESTLTISEQITPTLNNVKSDIATSENILSTLEDIQTRSIESEDGISLQSIILEINSLEVHSYSDVLLAEVERDQVVSDMDSINTDTNEKLLLCPST